MAEGEETFLNRFSGAIVNVQDRLGGHSVHVRGARGSQCVCKRGQGSQSARERPSKKQSLHFMLRCSHVTEGQLAHTHSVTGSLPRWKSRLTSSYDTGMNSLVKSTDALQAHAPQQESELLNLLCMAGTLNHAL